MRKIVVSIQNGLLAEAITGMLNDSGEFQPFRVPVGNKKNDVISNCEMLSADILIAEVSYASGTTVEARLREVKDADLRAIVEPKGQPAVLVYQHPIYHDRPDGIAPCVQNPRLLFQGADEQGHRPILPLPLCPGDFTTTGHFIVFTGPEDGLLCVNDPNSRKNSEKRWAFEDISDQIRNLWVITK